MHTRYNAYGAETRFEPGSDGQVLENLVHIKRAIEMEQAEYDSLSNIQEEYSTRILTSDARITASLIKQMHYDWLGKLYAWAGHYRTVNLAKGNFKWPPFGFIESSMAQFEINTLRKLTPCRASDIKDLARQLAEVHAEFLLIHPFRDGNGRLARWIADIMAIQAGYAPPDYRFSSGDSQFYKQQYITAVLRGYQCDLESLTAFFSESLERGHSEES